MRGRRAKIGAASIARLLSESLAIGARQTERDAVHVVIPDKLAGHA